MPFSRDWTGETVLIIGGGPSFKRLGHHKMLSEVRKRMKVVAVNRAHRLAPWADLLYGADPEFWKDEGVQGVSSDDVLWADGPATFSHLAGVVTGQSSAFHAWNLAFQFGAKEVLLTGIDMRTYEPGRKYHWHEGYGTSAVPDFWQVRQDFHRVAQQVPEYAARTFNLNPDSAVRCFPFARLEDWLA